MGGLRRGGGGAKGMLLPLSNYWGEGGGGKGYVAPPLKLLGACPHPLFLRLCPLPISDFICSRLPTPATDTSYCTITPVLTDVYFILPVYCFIIANLATVSKVYHVKKSILDVSKSKFISNY